MSDNVSVWIKGVYMKSFKSKLAISLFLSTFLLRMGFFLAAGIILLVLATRYPSLGYYGAALIIFDIIVSSIETIRCFRALKKSDHPVMQDLKKALDENSPEYGMDEFTSNLHSTAGRVCEYFLKKRIDKNSNVTECVNAFESMCKTEDSIKDDMLLFESGIYMTEGDSYIFSLTRQYPDGEGEYFQVYMRLKFEAKDEFKKLHESIWDEDMKIDFFEYVRGSESYKTIEGLEIKDIEIGLDET